MGAVIVSDERVLAAKRGSSGSLPNMWEFPGGKVEDGESPQEALAREISEELLVDIRVGEEILTTIHDYEFGVVTLTTYYCKLRCGTPQRTEHAALRWLTPDELSSVEWAPADVPAVERVRSDLRTG
ncbi:(deoxy)nucleoside triphosphate pyrophosphohydrolase [Microbacterium ulmi]|uniref:(deoxy)nucleoside triphosphate pyrophosphohydrolase n=1 Tax=Microbacterium ulmi TaxID=179095 RepID=UPI003133217A